MIDNEIIISTMCSGIGAPEVAIEELGVSHKIGFACDKDKFAREAYLANFRPGRMVKNISTPSWKWPGFYSDLAIAGLPCQAFSLAGLRLGEADPRGVLFYDFYRYVKYQRPKAFILENVKGLLSDNNGKTFSNWVQLLGQSLNGNMNMFHHPDCLHYNLHFKVLNAKHHGLPHNRERVFLVGIRNDLPNNFHFPKRVKLDKKLIDYLEPAVDERFFVSQQVLDRLNIKGLDKLPDDGVFVYKKRRTEEGKAIRRITGTNPHSASEIFFSKSDVMNCLTTGVNKEHYIVVPEATKKGYAIARQGDSINLSHPNSETRRGRVGVGVVNTLQTTSNQGVLVNNRIRQLTPLEFMRLQGFPDSYNKPCSETQIYKQAGNSMPVHLIKGIIKNLLPIIVSK